MANQDANFSAVIFGIALLATFVVAYLGRRDSKRVASAAMAEHRLNRWLVGLSAGATANSGFVVTGAVGLGYSFGAQWLLLPLSWLIGDLLFWLLFPNRINATGRAINATTMTDLIVDGMKPRQQVGLKRTVAVLVLLCLGGYVSAQWLAGQKFLQGAFGIGSVMSLLVFAALIVIYTAIGGFRGSVYADTLQAIVRVIGTAIALTVVVVIASRTSDVFWRNIEAAGPGFLDTGCEGIGPDDLRSLCGRSQWSRQRDGAHGRRPLAARHGRLVITATVRICQQRDSIAKGGRIHT